jgi:hypothetical protein
MENYPVEKANEALAKAENYGQDSCEQCGRVSKTAFDANGKLIAYTICHGRGRGEWRAV